MGHNLQFGMAADPDIAEAVGERDMEQRDIGHDRRQGDDRIVRGKGVVDNPVVAPVFDDVGADQPAQRHEGNAFFARLQPGIDGRTGAVDHPDRPRFHGAAEARRLAVFAERHAAGLDSRHAAGADQHVGLEPAGRGRHQMQVPHAAPDQGTGRRHRRAAAFGLEHGNLGAVRHLGGKPVDIGEKDIRHGAAPVQSYDGASVTGAGAKLNGCWRAAD